MARPKGKTALLAEELGISKWKARHMIKIASGNCVRCEVPLLTGTKGSCEKCKTYYTDYNHKRNPLRAEVGLSPEDQLWVNSVKEQQRLNEEREARRKSRAVVEIDFQEASKMAYLRQRSR